MPTFKVYKGGVQASVQAGEAMLTLDPPNCEHGCPDGGDQLLPRLVLCAGGGARGCCQGSPQGSCGEVQMTCSYFEHDNLTCFFVFGMSARVMLEVLRGPPLLVSLDTVFWHCSTYSQSTQ